MQKNEEEEEESKNKGTKKSKINPLQLHKQIYLYIQQQISLSFLSFPLFSHSVAIYIYKIQHNHHKQHSQILI